MRSVIHYATFYTIYYSAKFASKANMNQGVVATLFLSSIVWSIIIFYFVYQEKLTKRLVIGISLIIFGVVIIALAKNYVQIDSPSSNDGNSIVWN